MITRYVMKGQVTRVFEKQTQRHVAGVKEHAEFQTESGGWWIEINKLTTFFVGDEKPTLEEGAYISIILQPDGDPTVAPEPVAPQPVHPVQAAGEAVA